MLRISRLLLILAAACFTAPCRGGDIEGDEKETALGKDETLAQRQEAQRQALLKALGAGPVYQVDILFRDASDRLFLCQTVLSPQRPWTKYGTPGLGLDAKGKPIRPPDQGMVARARLEQANMEVRTAGDKTPRVFPKAETAYGIGASLDKGAGKSLTIFVSDVATGLTLPIRPGEPQVVFFHSRLFRVELLTPEQVKEYRPLTKDPDYFRRRTEALFKEMRTRHRGQITKDDGELAGAAILLRDAEVVELVRKRCREWIDAPQTNPPGGRPAMLADALAKTGDTGDVALFRKWVKRHPGEYWVAQPVQQLAARIGPKEALPLLTEMLNDAKPTGASGYQKRLIEAVPTIPEPTWGDWFLISTLRQYKRSPADFGFLNVPERLLRERLALSADERMLLELHQKNPYDEHWLLASAADRRRAVEQMIGWLRTNPKLLPRPPEE